MTNTERGLYITLLCIQWNKGSVSTSDIERTAQGFTEDGLAIVISKFEHGKDGKFRNKRLEIEREKQKQHRKNRSNSGKSGAYARWHSHDSANGKPITKDGSPSPSPSPKKEEGRGASLSCSKEIEEIFEEWNAVGLKQCIVVSDKRRRSLQVRLRESFFSENWRSALQRIGESDFCRGVNDRGWKASFDWFIMPDVVVKIMEGKYDNAVPGNGQKRERTINDTMMEEAIANAKKICESL